MHEASHASACLLTGGSVSALEVNVNEGGVTKFSGGWRRIVTPAGYLGGAFWGAAGTACCGTFVGQILLCALLALGLLATLYLCLAHTSRLENPVTTIATCVGFLAVSCRGLWKDTRSRGRQVLAALIAMYVLVDKDALRFGLLFVTTYVSLFSVVDIYDDCVARYVSGGQKSDAVVCEQLCPVLPARGWGVVWVLMSVGFWFCGICAYFPVPAARKADPRVVPLHRQINPNVRESQPIMVERQSPGVFWR